MPGPVAVEVRYVAGAGVLLGAGSRWLLIDVSDPDDPSLETVWDLLTAPTPATERVLAAVDKHYGDECSLVLVDFTSGAETRVARGSGRIVDFDGGCSLRLGENTRAGARRLVSGIVAASAADLLRVTRPTGTASTPRPPPVAGPGVIDGVPPEILAASAPNRATDIPPGATTSEPSAPAAGDQRRLEDRIGHTVRRIVETDHDGETTYRPGGASPAASAASGTRDDQVDHLHQSTHETVLAVHCPAGHTTPAFTASCRVCHVAVPPQEPHRMPRPRLGVLHLPDGVQVLLDRGVVFGRQPSVPPAGEDWPQLVRLPTENTYVSRNHLQVELDGWLVLATDLGSRGGTTLRMPGRSPERIRAGERYIWEPGQVFDLADSFEILYEVR